MLWHSIWQTLPDIYSDILSGILWYIFGDVLWLKSGGGAGGAGEGGGPADIISTTSPHLTGGEIGFLAQDSLFILLPLVLGVFGGSKYSSSMFFHHVMLSLVNQPSIGCIWVLTRHRNTAGGRHLSVWADNLGLGHGESSPLVNSSLKGGAAVWNRKVGFQMTWLRLRFVMLTSIARWGYSWWF